MEKHSNKINYLILFIVALIISVPLLKEGINIGHDGEWHIARVIGTVEQITNGDEPFVISRFSDGFGFGWNLFYPPMSTVINAIFFFLTNDYFISMKLFIFITFLFSGITMYRLVYTISNSKKAALISGIIYMIAPYRLLDSYVRLAVGEMVSFIFIPMIFKGAYEIFKQEKSKINPSLIFGSIRINLIP